MSAWRISSSLLLLVLAVPAAAQPSLLADLAPGGFEWLSLPRDATGVAEAAVFTLSTATTGRELWRSDGREEGTFLLVDACSGPCDGRVVPLLTEGGLHLFHAQDALWRTDGTRAGTIRLARLLEHEFRVLGSVEAGFLLAWRRDFDWWLARVGPGDDRLEVLPRIVSSSDFPLWGGVRTADGRRAFFVEAGSRRVWISDGSTGGSFALPPFEQPVSAIHPLGDGMAIWEGNRLWLSDGSPTGTLRLVTFEDLPASGSSRIGFVPGGGPDEVFFVVFPPFGVAGRRLWVTDGTPTGTRELLRAPDLDVVRGVRGRMPVSGGRLAYRVGGRLWTTDGTPTGARAVDAPCARCSWAEAFAYGAGFVLTLFRDSIRELWWADGVSGRLRKLLDLPVVPFAGSDPPPVVEHGSDLYLVAEERLVRLAPGPRAEDLGPASEPVLAAAGPWILFQRDLGLWRTGGSATEPLSLPGDTAGHSQQPASLTPIGDRLCFWSETREVGSRVACATRDGEVEVPFFVQGSSFPGPIVPLEKGMLLSSFDSMWVAEDGAPTAVRVTRNGSNQVFVLGGRALFHADAALWTSDGSLAGTGSFYAPAPAAPVVQVGDRAILLGSFESETLGSTDGTAAGTFELPLPDGARVLSPVVELDGSGWFHVSPDQLWRTDGTPEGTRLAQTLPAGFWKLLPASGAGRLFLVRLAHREGELWATDGASPPRVLRSIADFSERAQWEVFGTDERLWLSLDDGVHGRELWVSDGTPEGTRLFVDLWPGANPSSPQGFTLVAGRLYFVADDGDTGAELWTVDGSGATRLTDLAPGADSSSPAEMTAWGDRLYFVADDGIHGREIWSLPLGGTTAGCAPSPTRLCLAGGRFAVEVHWRDPYNGGEGAGRAEPLPGSDQSGVFWFFDSTNVELLVKVLDAAPVNGHHWVFYGALSTVEYWLDVTDTATGRVRRYYNPPGEQCGRGDTGAFPASSARTPAAGARRIAASPRVAATDETGCAAADRLCLLGGRFAVSVDWHDPRSGDRGRGFAISGSDGTGYFWFFDPANVELVVKLLDGTAVNGHRWVFYGGLSDVRYEIRVDDLVTGERRTYVNPFGEICGGSDTAAFARGLGGGAR